MKLLVVIPYKDFYSEELYEYLNKSEREIEITILCPPCCYDSSTLLGKIQSLCVIFFNFFYFLFYLLTTGKRKHDVILLGGNLVTVSFLLVMKILPFIKASKNVIVTTFFVHQLGENRVFRKVLLFLFSVNKLIILVQSHYEIDYYTQISEKAKVVYYPFCRRLLEVSGSFGKEDGEYIFAGGYTNRDYECLFKAAEKIKHKFLIICSSLNSLSHIPSNVTILSDVTPDEFYSYLKNSKMVIIPLKQEVGSSGQMVALTAMSFRKPVIYTNIGSISQYFEDDISGISYQRGDADDLFSKISHLLSNPDLCRIISSNAVKSFYEKYHISRYHDFLTELIITSGL